MEFKLNVNDKKQLDKLFETNEINYTISNMYNYFFYNLARSIKKSDIESIKRINNCSEKDAYFQLFLDRLDIDVLDSNSYTELKDFCYQGIICLNDQQYQNNQYLKTIHFHNQKLNDIKLDNDCYLPYESFPLFDVKVDEENYFKEEYSLGYFKTKFSFPAVSKNNVIWMSIIPNEIETMKKSINEVKGNVLVYGLGLGYYPFMIGLKDNVKKITIIEKDLKIIKLFKEYILPQFPNKEKINIVNHDAFEFEKKLNHGFDYAFVDLYHGDEDGVEIYLKFKELEKSNCTYHYWLEDSLINVIRRNLITILYENYTKTNCNYDIEESFNDRIINHLYLQIKNTTFTTYDQIKTLLSKNSITQLIKQIKII